MDTPQRAGRQAYQRHQGAWLAPCAVAEADCGGRKSPEADHPYRTCFQRDRDRIIHCSAFRRLDFKTQVFVPHVDDHFRTRLTHTLEVAQIARDLARALRLNEDLAEAVALAHDLGHAPFGHTGQQVLDELMADHGRFEHNRQSLRVVDYLEHPYPDFRGLNLTAVVRECLAKHETKYDTPICEDCETALAAPLEGQLVDFADEIAFTAADLDDALAAGWITLEQLAELDLWRRAWARAETDAPHARTVHKRIRACKGVLAAMADDVIATSARNVAEMNVQSPDDVRRAETRCAAMSDQTDRGATQIQKFLLENVYRHPRGADHRDLARRTITGLFSAYTGNPDLLDKRYRSRIEADGLHRVACDFIAGMTDRYCIEAHAKLSG